MLTHSQAPPQRPERMLHDCIYQIASRLLLSGLGSRTACSACLAHTESRTTTTVACQQHGP